MFLFGGGRVVTAASCRAMPGFLGLSLEDHVPGTGVIHGGSCLQDERDFYEGPDYEGPEPEPFDGGL